ncbi:hypothetical protein [Hymenobacter saemangeumensis]
MRLPRLFQQGYTVLAIGAALWLSSCNHNQKKVDDDVPVEAADTLHTPSAVKQQGLADSLR